MGGVIVNPRGTSGAGKTELVRRILGAYGWPRGCGERRRPGLAWRLAHPRGGRPLAVLGPYASAAAAGGCDRIRAAEGGLGEVFRLADAHAASGDDVLLEGLELSAEHHRSALLARRHPLHVLRLATPLERCVRNAAARQRASAARHPAIRRKAAAEQARIEAACSALQGRALVETLPFDDALRRARELLALDDG
jgi:hypothetical protein